MERIGVEYRQLYREYEEVQQLEDKHIMEEMLVIGMTTTGAARKQTLLQALKCPIVVVEEAAEVRFYYKNYLWGGWKSYKKLKLVLN